VKRGEKGLSAFCAKATHAPRRREGGFRHKLDTWRRAGRGSSTGVVHNEGGARRSRNLSVAGGVACGRRVWATRVGVGRPEKGGSWAGSESNSADFNLK
jgi:hypothetical protein